MAGVAGCVLCETEGGHLVARHPDFRVIRTSGPEAEDFPLFYRVVWQTHVAEWTDLPPTQRQRVWQVLEQLEQQVRQHLRPTKVNLASLGNVVPHLHWHVIARYDWDSRWPAPVWAPAQRVVDPARWAALLPPCLACDAAVAAWVAGLD